MAENAIAFYGNNGESRANFRRFVVPILLYRREQDNLAADPPNPIVAISGIVIVSVGEFCYIIANEGLLFPKNREKFRDEVVFPNGTTLDLDILEVESYDKLAAFYCRIEPGVVDAVPFCTDITENMKLKMYLYELNVSKQLVDDVTDGYVTHVGKNYIAHDCTPSRRARNGSPVFSEQQELVGISFKDAGVTKALDVNRITRLLSGFYEGMNNRPLPEILQHIQAVGEEKIAQGVL